ARRRIAEGLQAPAAVPQTTGTAAATPVRVKVGAAAPVRVKVGAAAPAGHTKGGTSARAGRGRRAGDGARPGGGSGQAATAEAGGTAAGNGAGPDAELMSVTLRRLRWSVAVETVIAVVVLAVTAVLVNTPTAREFYFPPASASTTFDTGGPGG